MNIMYLGRNTKGDPTQLFLLGIKSFHVSQAHHDYLFFVTDGKEYTSCGTIYVEEDYVDENDAVQATLATAPAPVQHCGKCGMLVNACVCPAPAPDDVRDAPQNMVDAAVNDSDRCVYCQREMHKHASGCPVATAEAELRLHSK